MQFVCHFPAPWLTENLVSSVKSCPEYMIINPTWQFIFCPVGFFFMIS